MNDVTTRQNPKPRVSSALRHFFDMLLRRYPAILSSYQERRAGRGKPVRPVIAADGPAWSGKLRWKVHPHFPERLHDEPGATFSSLWSLGSAPIGLSLHVAFKVSLTDVLDACNRLRSRGTTPLSFFATETASMRRYERAKSCAAPLNPVALESGEANK